VSVFSFESEVSEMKVKKTVNLAEVSLPKISMPKRQSYSIKQKLSIINQLENGSETLSSIRKKH
jgi:hypothetical protein